MTRNTTIECCHDDVHHEHEHNADGVDVFGFWLYIMTDCVLFASLFAAFAVLHNNTFGGPALRHFISLPYVLGETLFLLFSNLTYGFAIICMYKARKALVNFWLVVTVILGLGFVLMELSEFIHIIHEGHGPQTSAAMTGFFSLVGTHGLHVSFGLLWMVVLIIQLLRHRKIDNTMVRRLTLLGLFWNFLDIVWIFVFTVVYLMGVL